MLAEAREVCPTTTLRMSRNGALLVDVRERDEIDRLAFDVPQVVAMPMSEFEQRCGELPRDRELVMVCAVGERSLKATYFLMYRGYANVQNMKGGIARWARKGFAVKGDVSAAQAPAGTGCNCSAATAPTDDVTPAPLQGCCAPHSRAGTCC